MSGKATVYIIDDDEAVRNGIADLVKEMGAEVQTFSLAEEFLNSYQHQENACLVLDIRMPGMSGLELLEELNKQGIYIPTIIISGHGDIPMAVDAVKKGAVNFIEKPFREHVLWENIKKALEGSSELHRLSLERAKIKENISKLTPKDREIMELLVSGMSDKEIAHQIKISRRAVAFHRTAILRKLEISTVVELANLSAKLDILKLP